MWPENVTKPRHSQSWEGIDTKFGVNYPGDLLSTFLHLYKCTLIQMKESWNFVGINIFSTLAVAWFCHIFMPHLCHFTPTRADSGMGAPSYFDQRLKIYHDVKFHASSVLYIMVTKMTKMLFIPFTPFTPLTPKLWSNDENTLQKW